MKYVPVSVLLSVMSMLLLLDVVVPKPAPVDYKHLVDVSCKIEFDDGGGSGVFVTRKVGSVNRTFVWTAAHVAECVRNTDGTFGTVTIVQDNKKVKANVIAYSSDEDLALLEIITDNYTSASATFVQDDKEIQPGTELVHVGSVTGLCNSISTGCMSRVNHKFTGEKEVFDQTTVMAYPGSSGGGVFMRDGRCVGLLVRGIGPGVNFIVPVRRMRAWAEKENILWALDPTQPIPVEVKKPLKSE